MDGVYRCDIRSVQQELGGQKRRLYTEVHAKRANGAISIRDAWGVKKYRRKA